MLGTVADLRRRTARLRCLHASAVTGPDARSTSPRLSVLPTTADIQFAWLAARHAGALALLGDRLTDAALKELELLAEELERRDICGVTIFPTMPELIETLARPGRTGEAREMRDTWRGRVGVDPSTIRAATLARLDAHCAESIDESDVLLRDRPRVVRGGAVPL